MENSSENPDEWRKRAIFRLIMRLLLGLIQIGGVIAAIWLFVVAGAGWRSCGAVIITLFCALVSWLLFSQRSAL